MENNEKIIPELMETIDDNFLFHLDIPNNERILFSGIFGIGKTTFLKYFFDKEEVKSKYNVFHLFPVNYPVLNNEDIFKYIKYDIIYDLVEKNFLKFENERFEFLEDAPAFVKQNIYGISTLLLLLVPTMGRQYFKLSKELEKLHDKFMKFSSKENIEGLAVAELLNSFNKKDGDLYEFNVLTMLIKNTLDKLKENTNGDKKENVLIIDDLDRIDPNHIFRLFNIFSAHFDRNQKGEANKFGFDKIILVCDVQNIKNIYNHAYGIDTDFNGYIDKFYSRQVFTFDNYENISSFLEGIFGELNLIGKVESLTEIYNAEVIKNTLVHLFYHILQTRSINLRNLLRNYRVGTPIDLKSIKIDETESIPCWQYLIVAVIKIARSYFIDIDFFKEALKKVSNVVGEVNIQLKNDHQLGDIIYLLDLLEDRKNSTSKLHPKEGNTGDRIYSNRSKKTDESQFETVNIHYRTSKVGAHNIIETKIIEMVYFERFASDPIGIDDADYFNYFLRLVEKLEEISYLN